MGMDGGNGYFYKEDLTFYIVLGAVLLISLVTSAYLFRKRDHGYRLVNNKVQPGSEHDHDHELDHEIEIELPTGMK